MKSVERMKKKLNSLGDKYEKVNPLAVLKRAGIQYRMVRLQNKITNIECGDQGGRKHDNDTG